MHVWGAPALPLNDPVPPRHPGISEAPEKTLEQALPVLNRCWCVTHREGDRVACPSQERSLHAVQPALVPTYRSRAPPLHGSTFATHRLRVTYTHCRPVRVR